MSHQTFAKPRPRYLDKAEKRQAAKQLKRDVYRQVDQRDGYRCRACGRKCRRTMECVADRLEHHHLQFRSCGGEHTTPNVITLCLVCHVEAQQHRLHILGDADGQLRLVWS